MELIVKLKQHTPIIHFQHDQKGATLRATELKPKLDRYIKEKITSENLKKMFGEKGNLPYKVKIVNDGIGVIEDKDIEKIKKDGNGKIILDRNGKPKKNPFPTFFGNMGDVKEKKFILYRNINIIFESFYEVVIDTIKDNICDFLTITNFGTRQSKGFGSFFIDPQDSNKIYIDPKTIQNHYHFYVDTKQSNNYEKFKQLFLTIDLFYRTLRSGINIKYRNGDTEFYFKSLMFLYAKENKGWTWDKKVFKSKFVEPSILNKQKRNHQHSDILTYESDNEYLVLVRDLLGVAPSQVYKSERFEIKYDEENEIQRYKSPITFKPIETSNGKFNVYLIISPVNEDIFDKEFKIHKIQKDENDKPKIKDSLSIYTPSKGSFNIKKFFKYALSIDLDKHVDDEFKEHKYFSIISNIYNQLKGQVQ